CGQWNIFKWAHKEGGAASSDTTVLVADGQALLDSGDYAKAEEVFKKAFESNPQSSEACYGYAQAVIAASGLGLADLISSVIQQAKSPNPPPLPTSNPFIGFVSPQYALGLGPNLLDPTKLDLTKLYAISKKAIIPLKKIADNETDGKIPYDDFDINFNLAFCLTLHAVCGLLDWDGDSIPGAGTGDIINVTGEFKVTVDGNDDLSTIQNKKPTTQEEINKVKRQVYTSLNEVLDPSLNPGIPYLQPADYEDNKGALHYLVIALGKISPDAAKELKDNINKLATDTSNGISRLKDEINNW
ncbi:MAG TPA: hypothetical protein DHV62_00520, partial [Elusimicrobia bacterium]|nr:hypothetical protein [Elusimicrobiota bacterium]